MVVYNKLCQLAQIASVTTNYLSYHKSPKCFFPIKNHHYQKKHDYVWSLKILNLEKDFPDKDNDGIADSQDRDNDNDGILDEDDSDDYTPFADADGDGIHDNMDLDNDNDGIPDDMDDDDDNDGIPDDEDDDDNTPLSARLLDSDGDGIPDDEDEDDDNDGVPDDKDPDDNTPLGAPDQDGDGIADADDTDFIPPKTCPEGTPAQYDDPAHLMCPCGNFSPGQCKSGLFIPIWTNADIDAHLVKYIEFAFNPANAFRVNFTILENDNMKER